MVWLIDEWKKLWWEAKTDVMEVELFEIMIMQEPHYWLCNKIILNSYNIDERSLFCIIPESRPTK